MKNCLFVLLLALMGTQLFAAPTMEGLFRNGNNPDLSADLVVATFSVEELPSEVSKELLPTRYVKVFMSRSNSAIVALQADYADNRFAEPATQKSFYRTQLSDDVREAKFVERPLFYSVLSTLLLNDSRPMNHFLKAHSNGFKTNREAMSPEKLELLQKYKEYLIAISEEGGSVKDAIKASKEGNAEERAKAMEVITGGIYEKNDKVRLAREGGQFFWSVDLGAFKAFFSNEEHRLKKIQLMMEGGKNVELECGEYTLLNGTHELPKTMMLRDSTNSLYRISFLSLTHVSDKSGMSARAAKYDTLVKNNKNKTPALKFTQSFLY